MDNIFKTFNENFFRTAKGITWYDKQGLMSLDKDRIVTITIDDLGTKDSYNGYWVEIINKTSGSVAKKFFFFRHHLTMVHRDSNKYFHVWYNNEKFEWYISYPKNTKEMVDVVLDWISRFKIDG